MVNKGRGDDALVPLNTPPTAPHARRAPARDSRRGLAAARARSVPRHVVVVDPDPGMAVVTVLLRRVCRVTASDTASATVTDLRRLRPDLVIFDSDLQDLDVVAFGRALRTRYPGCPIVVVSANANVGALREMMEMPIDGFFKKPVRIDRLFEHIATLLPDLEAGGHVRPRPGPYINHALGEIAQRYKDRLSLGAIARSVNISRAYLARLFKRQTGATVREFLSTCAWRSPPACSCGATRSSTRSHGTWASPTDRTSRGRFTGEWAGRRGTIDAARRTPSPPEGVTVHAEYTLVQAFVANPH